MPVRIDCPMCRKPLTFDESFAGFVVQCPSCGDSIALPAATPAAPPLPDWAVPVPCGPAERPGGGVHPAVVAGGLVLSLVAAGMFLTLVFWRMDRAKRARLSRQEAVEEAEKLAKQAQRYVMVRWWVDDRVLPRERREGAEAWKIVGIRVEISNHGYESVAVDPMDFRLKVDGVWFGRPMPIGLERLHAGEVRDGQMVTGGLVFDAPDEWKEMSVEWSPTGPPGVRVQVEEMK